MSEPRLFEIQNRLVKAAALGDAVQVDLWLRRGANPDFRDSDEGDLALVAAARGRHEAVVARLLKAGANPERRSLLDGYSARALAETYGYRGVAALLNTAA